MAVSVTCRQPVAELVFSLLVSTLANPSDERKRTNAVRLVTRLQAEHLGGPHIVRRGGQIDDETSREQVVALS
jgi:hypothetical protein